MTSPRAVLFGAGEALPALPVCDHYAGVEPRMTKSLQLQAEMGPVFDVTLDNEDGAPVGGEVDQAHLIVSLLNGPDNRHGRVGVRLLPFDHPRFHDVAAIVLRSQAIWPWIVLLAGLSAADARRAKAEKRPLMVDFTAEWCAACKRMSKETFSDPRVMEKAGGFVAVKIDATDDEDPQIEAVKGKYKVVGLPTLVIYDSTGAERQRFNDFVGPDDFVKALDGIN